MKRTLLLVLLLALGLTTEIAKADFTFGEPTNLGPPVSTSADEYGPWISDDGLSLYFSSNRPGGHGGHDIWVATRASKGDNWGTTTNFSPIVNSSFDEGCARISVDGLSLYFSSNRPGGYGGDDIWFSTRRSEYDDWGTPVNLGPVVNSSAHEITPSLSSDSLELYFSGWKSPFRPGGYGNADLWVTTRPTKTDSWGDPVNLGPVVNSSRQDARPYLSTNGLLLFFDSQRTGGYGYGDLYVTRRATVSDPWGTPVNLGPKVNRSGFEELANISADGSDLFFDYATSSNWNDGDIWHVSIIPIVDLNGDGIVDSADMCIMVDYWGTDEPLCDIGPTPFGDGIVDIKDLIVLAEHLFEGIPQVEPEEVNIDENDAGSQVELEQGQILVVTLESNPTTGYSWEVVETQDSILEQMGEAEYKPSDTGEPPLVGAGGWEIFRFQAISAGQMTLQLVYHRPWEEGVEPVKTFSIQVAVN